jgi:hypothetical protein
MTRFNGVSRVLPNVFLRIRLRSISIDMLQPPFERLHPPVVIGSPPAMLISPNSAFKPFHTIGSLPGTLAPVYLLKNLLGHRDFHYPAVSDREKRLRADWQNRREIPQAVGLRTQNQDPNLSPNHALLIFDFAVRGEKYIPPTFSERM